MCLAKKTQVHYARFFLYKIYSLHLFNNQKVKINKNCTLYWLRNRQYINDFHVLMQNISDLTRWVQQDHNDDLQRSAGLHLQIILSL